MRIDELRYFVETVRCGSLNKASNVLFITQPALGAALNNFENEMGVQLLYRSSTGIRPTLFGRKLYEECLPLLEQIDFYSKCWQEHIHFYQNVYGNVQIGVFPLLSPFLASSFALDLSAMCPNISLSVQNFPLRHDLEKILTSPCNIVIGVLEVDSSGAYLDTLSKAKDLNLELEILAKDKLKVLINSKNKSARKGYLEVEELCGMNNITYSNKDRESSYRPSTGSEILYARSLDQIFQMIQENLGFFIAGEKIASHHFAVQSGLVKVLDLHGAELPNLYLYSLHLSDEQLSDAERAVVSAVRYAFSDGSAKDFPYNSNI